ncbi:hypothetical protein CHS0354_003751 [Potamilus streckersoni]|uniref:Uncharacterized protein n=1 Tax=Potamilus streckersoni TaxID=2493646 RepID=A0AAE0RU91_9BIVA|nr:hypothetical protein CHS0354_003751 [Potamilus streckersoni]
MVWLKDVTRSLKREKMTHDELDLPDELTFQLTGRSSALTLNLKRNHVIDPNADVYLVRNLKDGQPQLDKILSLEQENLAYYQDRENGAFVTVRCVKKSNGKCDRVIRESDNFRDCKYVSTHFMQQAGPIHSHNGNIRIGDNDFDILLVDLASRNGILGTQYVLREQENIQTYVSTERKSDATNINVKSVEQKFINNLGRLWREEKQNDFRLTSSKISSKNVASFHNRGTTGLHR